MGLKGVSVLIPAYNEEERLGATLDGLLEALSPSQILVIDDGSEDQTAVVAMERGVRLLSLPGNRGKGEALEAGLERTEGEVILFLDADLGATGLQALRLAEPVLEDEAEATIGLFPPPKKRGGLGVVRFVAQLGVLLLGGRRVRGVLSGQRAFRQELIRDLLPFASGFGLELGLTLDLLKRDVSFRELELGLRHRETGNDWQGFMHRGRQLLDILRVLVIKFRAGG